MKYSNQHDEKPFTIGGEPEEEDTLPNTDVVKTTTAPKGTEYTDTEVEQDAITAFATPIAQTGSLEEVL